MMTFDNFRLTKREVADLRKISGFSSPDHDKPVPGLTYCDVLYIERRTDEWIGDSKNYEFMLTIGRDGWLSNDLTELERELYKFAKEEGYLE